MSAPTSVTDLGRCGLFFAVLAVACGQVANGNDSGVAEGGSDSDNVLVDAGWTQCTSPDNIGICGGPSRCVPPNCPECYPQTVTDQIGPCGSPYLSPVIFPQVCHPGLADRACTTWRAADGGILEWLNSEFNYGALLAQNGDSADVRYADMGTWTVNTIPDPPSCPMMGSVLPCGGSCGTCPQDQTCYGRSPLHPVGICRPDAGTDCAVNHSCALTGVKGLLCFTYTVDPAAQPLADTVGMCFSAADCNAIAASLPGGGKCTP